MFRALQQPRVCVSDSGSAAPRPPLRAGINIKADISMWLACFLGSLCTLGLLHALYGLLVALRLLDPKLYRWAPPGGAGAGAAAGVRGGCGRGAHSRQL